MFKFRTDWLLPLALLGLAALAVAIGERAVPATSKGPANDVRKEPEGARHPRHTPISMNY